MTKRLLLILLTVLLFANAYAKQIEGTIIFLNKDTVKVTFNIPISPAHQGFPEPQFYFLQQRVQYWDRDGSKKFLLPTQAQEISFYYAGNTIRMLARHNPYGKFRKDSKNFMFLKLELDGFVKVFSYHTTTNSRTSSTYANFNKHSPFYSDVDVLLQKEAQILYRPGNRHFKEDLCQYFRDCQELVAYIMERELRSDHLESIVHRYNNECQTN